LLEVNSNKLVKLGYKLSTVTLYGVKSVKLLNYSYQLTVATPSRHVLLIGINFRVPVPPFLFSPPLQSGPLKPSPVVPWSLEQSPFNSAFGVS